MKVEQAMVLYNKAMVELSAKNEVLFNQTIAYITQQIKEIQAKSVYVDNLTGPVIRKLREYGYTVISSSHRNEVTYEISGWVSPSQPILDK